MQVVREPTVGNERAEVRALGVGRAVSVVVECTGDTVVVELLPFSATATFDGIFEATEASPLSLHLEAWKELINSLDPMELLEKGFEAREYIETWPTWDDYGLRMAKVFAKVAR